MNNYFVPTLSFLILTLQMCAVAMNAGAGAESPVTAVDEVNLERYVGVWYEIAKIPNRFQKQSVRGTTAEYTFREDVIAFRPISRIGSLEPHIRPS